MTNTSGTVLSSMGSEIKQQFLNFVVPSPPMAEEGDGVDSGEATNGSEQDSRSHVSLPPAKGAVPMCMEENQAARSCKDEPCEEGRKTRLGGWLSKIGISFTSPKLGRDPESKDQAKF